MRHRNCNGNIQLDLGGMYSLRSPAINISTKGVSPGIVEITTKDKKTGTCLICDSCDHSFSSKDEFEKELLEACSICNNEFPPSQIIITDYIPKICTECLNKNPDDFSRSSMGYKYLSVYGENLKGVDYPTLLTVLLKKQ